MKRSNSKKGFALLIATLVSGLFLAISAVIFQIAYVELLLSSVGRDSQFAFYAADTGAECALYWDRKYDKSGQDGSDSAFNVGDQAISSDPIAYDDSNRQRIIGVGITLPFLSPIDCAGVDINPPRLGGSNAGSVNFRQGDFGPSGQLTWTFFKFPINGASSIDRGCVEVVVKKEEILPSTVPPSLKTTIISRGYNTCDTTSPRRVERAIQVTLQ